MGTRACCSDAEQRLRSCEAGLWTGLEQAASAKEVPPLPVQPSGQGSVRKGTPKEVSLSCRESLTWVRARKGNNAEMVASLRVIERLCPRGWGEGINEKIWAEDGIGLQTSTKRLRKDGGANCKGKE